MTNLKEYDLSSHPLQVDYCKGHPDAKVNAMFDIKSSIQDSYRASLYLKKRIDISYRKAAMKAIEIRSDKSIIGVGNKGVIKGKGSVLSLFGD